MEKKDMVIVGLVVLLVLVVAFSGNLGITGKAFKRSCTDTDGGSSFVKGTISGTDTAGNSFEMTDYCSVENSDVVKEYSCSQDIQEGWTSKTEFCESGCVEGACV